MFKDCKTYLSKYDELIKYYLSTSTEILENGVLEELSHFSKNQFNLSVEALACGYVNDLKNFYERNFKVEVFYALFTT